MLRFDDEFLDYISLIRGQGRVWYHASPQLRVRTVE